MVPGPAAEVRTVRWIFATFVAKKMRRRDIARALNRRGITNVAGNPWTSLFIRRVLTNERYIGNNVWNRTSGRLRTKRVNNHPDNWVRVERACEAIVDRRLFDKAQMVLREEKRIISLEDKLAPFRQLLRQHGRLTSKLINHASGVPHSASYRRWFGNLHSTYALVGFVPPWRQPGACKTGVISTQRLSKERLLEDLRQLLLNRGVLSDSLINESRDVPCAGTYRNRFGSLRRAYELIGHVPRTRNAKRVGACRNLNNKQLLNKLRALLIEKGRLTAQIIDADPEMPSYSTYVYRFGCMSRAYELIGYDVGTGQSLRAREHRRTYTDDYLLDTLRAIRKKYGALSRDIVAAAKAGPALNTYDRRFGRLSRAFELIGYAPVSDERTFRPPPPAPRRSQNPRQQSNREMLRALRALWRERGRLSAEIIDKSRSVPAVSLYRARFGTISRVYKLIGYRPSWYAHRPKLLASLWAREASILPAATTK
jgi:hypothetical protein